MYKTILIVILLLIIVYLLMCASSSSLINSSIQKLIKQSARWAIASENDISPLIKVLHANYAAGYLWAVTDIATSSDIENATGIDILKFTKKITDIQDSANKKIMEVCPSYMGDIDPYLTAIAET